MWKQAWKSYLASLQPRNYKKINGDNFFGLAAVYWLIINPIFQDYSGNADAVEQISFWIMTITPYILMWWSNLGGRLSMPKQMYLLPMEQSERGKYIHTLLFIKIGFPAFVGLILQLIRGLMYEINLEKIVLCTLGTISFGIGMYVCSSLRSKFDRYIRYAVRGKDGTGKDAFLNWMCMIYSIIYHTLVAAGESTGTDPLWVDLLWLIAPLAIMIIMDIAIIKTRYLWTIVDVCNYEESFKVLGKVK